MRVELSSKSVNRLSWPQSSSARESWTNDSAAQEDRMTDKAPTVKQLYRLSVEPRDLIVVPAE